ncbi:MAG TPA: hypothetical protein VGA49_02640, partial [Patescibacteria group bacterium]
YTGLIGSDNNAMAALARSTGLSPEEFADLMNAKADSLKMNNSHFIEPTGLSPLNVSTARDVLKLARAAFADEKISEILRIKKYQFTSASNISHTVYSTDLLLNSFLNADPYQVVAGKTGFINEAGYCLTAQISHSEQNGEILAVVLGTTGHLNRFDEMKGLVSWVFDNYEF